MAASARMRAGCRLPDQGAAAARQRQEGARAAQVNCCQVTFLGKIGVDAISMAALAVPERDLPDAGQSPGVDGIIAGQHPARACSVPSSRVSTASSALWRRLVTAAGVWVWMLGRKSSMRLSNCRLHRQPVR